MHELADQIWRLEKTITLSPGAAEDPDIPIDSMEQALLEAVEESPGIHPAGIAKTLAITRVAVGKRLNALKRKGYVAVAADEKDGRRVTVTLASPGANELERIRKLRSDNAALYLANWSDEDQAQIITLFKRLNDEIEHIHSRDVPGWARGRQE